MRRFVPLWENINMKLTLIALIILATFALMACDVRSDTAKREMEKFTGTPTPVQSPTPTEAPIDPSAIVQADTNGLGELIDLYTNTGKKSVECKKFERVEIYSSNNEISVKGVCRQIKISGDNNKVTADAVMALIFAGDNNTIRYSRYVNGKRPSVQGSSSGNVIEEVPASKPTAK